MESDRKNLNLSTIPPFELISPAISANNSETQGRNDKDEDSRMVTLQQEPLGALWIE
jgi:hypothetical protein